ncbi:DUF4855 domain-containing protein [Paenibacillus sp. GCM10027626]|uniref:DUF4855 domain-containing protein n=1 Tax=Paenibacillus sp. GCM10027626 TaxID=3273411 RepID=UPI003642A49A
MNKTYLTALVILLVTMMSFQQSSVIYASGQLVNLAQGKPYSISVKSPNQSKQNQEASYPDTGGAELTDGLLASSNNFWDPRYTGWYKQGERTVTIDLQSANFIHGIHIHLLQDPASGVHFPGKLTFEVSNDGTVWTGAGHVSPVQTNQLKADWFVLSGLKEPGRYVRIHIPVNMWVFTDEIQVWGINSLSEVNVAYGKSYSTTASVPNGGDAATEAAYADNSSKLTNGTQGSDANPFDPAYAGWYKQGQRTIVVDLERNAAIKKAQMRFIQNGENGIYFPEWVRFELSDDGQGWSLAGEVPSAVPAAQPGTHVQWFSQDIANVKARYLKITFPVNIWVFSDEIRIIGFAGQEEKLSSSKPYTISATFPDSLLTADEGGYPDAGGELTNGVLGSSTLSDPAWQGWLRQDMRHITLDLQNESTVHQIRMRFFQNKGASIVFPEYVRYDISHDKINWRTLGEVPTGIYRSEPGALTQWFTLDNLNDSGRYIRAVVPSGVWVFADELEVYGGYGVHEGSTPAGGTPDVQADKGYPAGNMRQLLVYAGHYPQDPSFATWTQEHFRRYAGYVNTNGDIVDTMFNSFLFLPAEITAPSGRRFDESGTPSNKEDWDYMLDRFFAVNQQIDALNKAVGEVRQATGQSGFKPTVYITIPYPSPEQTRWGDINNDGVINDADSFGSGTDRQTALNNRKAAVKQFIDEVILRFNSGGYEKLQLEGFYWVAESIPHSKSPDELTILQEIGQEVRSRGLKLEWIPYHQAEGFRDWDKNAVDFAFMQPNYMFTNSLPSRIGETAKLAKRYGMGVEMELDGYVSMYQEHRNKYYQYLNGGVTYGYMTQSKVAWYDWIKTLYSASSSIYLDVREVYDATYRFIKGTYTVKPIP